MSEERKVVIGEISGTFGLKGDVKIIPHTDFPERFEKLETVYVQGEGIPGRILRVEKAWHHNRHIIVKFEGVDDPSAAAALRGGKLLIGESELMPLEEDEYYIHDIIGMEVVTSEGENLGTITEVRRSPSNDIYVTDRAMIPAIKEYVENIDLQERKIVVRDAEGLIQE